MYIHSVYIYIYTIQYYVYEQNVEVLINAEVCKCIYIYIYTSTHMTPCEKPSTFSAGRISTKELQSRLGLLSRQDLPKAAFGGSGSLLVALPEVE